MVLGIFLFGVVFGTALLVVTILIAFLLTPNPPSNEMEGESNEPHLIWRETAKDVKFNQIMRLRSPITWTLDGNGFTEYHLLSAYQPNSKCVEVSKGTTKCDVEEKRVFRWMPKYERSPMIDCDKKYCYVPYPIFKTDFPVIPFSEAQRFPITNFIKKLKKSKLRAKHGQGMHFRGPGSGSVWWKVLHIYIQGYINITAEGKAEKKISYNHTVAIDTGGGILDAIYGLALE